MNVLSKISRVNSTWTKASPGPMLILISNLGWWSYSWE